jgi:radical SAM protein with 4Fe4S-binding SPASM domain
MDRAAEPVLIRLLERKAALEGAPFNAIFELTPRCNLSCRMCYIRVDAGDIETIKREKSAEFWIKTATQLRDAGMLVVLLTGGEPLLHPAFKEIFTALSKLGLIRSINTNATLIDESWVAFFQKNPPNRINVSLYAASADGYERVSGNRGGYERGIKGIERLIAAGLCVTVRTLVTPENAGEIAAITDFCKRSGVPLAVQPYAFPPSRRADKTQSRLSAEAAAAVMIENFSQKERDQRIASAKKYNELLQKNLESGKVRFGTGADLPERETLKAVCNAGRTSAWVTFEGKMLVCCMLDEISEDIEQLGVPQAWERTKKNRDKLTFPARCAGCADRELCSGCPAAHFNETGRFDTVSEYICRMSQIYLKYLEKIV